jgi:hypothetical protein
MPQEKTEAAHGEPSPNARAAEELRAKIEEVRRRVEAASKPVGPLAIFGVHTSST